MSEVRTEFLETSAVFKVDSLPLSHVSVEVGHLYMEDLAEGEDAVRRTLAAAAPWVRAARTPEAIGCEKKSVRLSTCFLIDDYFSRFSSPAEMIPMVLAAAEREDLGIDYLARESACASAGGVSPASLTLGSLVTEPTPGTPAGRRVRLADQRAAVADHCAGRGDGQARPVAAAPGKRAPTTLDLRRCRTVG